MKKTHPRHHPQHLKKVTVLLRCPTRFEISVWKEEYVSFTQWNNHGYSALRMSLLIGTCLFVLLINLQIGLILLLLSALFVAQLPRPHGMTNDYERTNAWWIDEQGRVEKVKSFGSDPSHAPRHITIIKKGTRVRIPHTNEQIVFTLDPSEQSVQAMVDLLVLLLSVHRWERRNMLRRRIGIRIDDRQGYTNLGPDGIEIQTIA